MNVTVVVPEPLQKACEGRARIELGMPAIYDVGDVIDTLLSLYPGLRAFLADEKNPLRTHFGVAGFGRMLFLFSTSSKKG